MKVSKEKEMLASFGKEVAQFVRDESIERLLKILAGHVKAPRLVRLSDKLEQLDEHAKDLLKEVALLCIDNAIDNFLWLFEEKEEFDLIGYTDPEKDSFVSLRDASDGLSVDYWNFVDEFSKFKRLDDEE